MFKITGEYGYSADVDLAFNDVNPEDFDMLIQPGGKAPEKVRLEKKALSVGAKKGRNATCYIGIRDDLKSAGAMFEDKEVVVDSNLITSSHPRDLYAFGRELAKKAKLFE